MHFIFLFVFLCLSDKHGFQFIKQFLRVNRLHAWVFVSHTYAVIELRHMYQWLFLYQIIDSLLCIDIYIYMECFLYFSSFFGWSNRIASVKFDFSRFLCGLFFHPKTTETKFWTVGKKWRWKIYRSRMKRKPNGHFKFPFRQYLLYRI